MGETLRNMRAPTATDAVAFMRPIGGFWYVATPYTKYAAGREVAFHEACRVTAMLLEAGVKAYSPIAHTHPIAQYTATCETDHEFWLDVDRPFMDAATGICVVTMPGWDESRGVEFEIREFEKAGKPIVLLEWMMSATNGADTESFGELEMRAVNEACREYVYPDGHRQMFDDVTHFAAGHTTHRLRLGSGRFVIVHPGWDYVELELPAGWSL